MSDPKYSMFDTTSPYKQDYGFSGQDMGGIPVGYQAPIQAGFQQPPAAGQASLADMFMNWMQGNQQGLPVPDYKNAQDSWFTGNYLRDDAGTVQTDTFGNAIMEQGMTGLDMTKLGMAGLQGFMGYKGAKDQVKLARDALNLKRQAFDTQVADAKRLRTSAMEYANAQRGDTSNVG